MLRRRLALHHLSDAIPFLLEVFVILVDLQRVLVLICWRKVAETYGCPLHLCRYQFLLHLGHLLF